MNSVHGILFVNGIMDAASGCKLHKSSRGGLMISSVILLFDNRTNE